MQSRWEVQALRGEDGERRATAGAGAGVHRQDVSLEAKM